jgi:shikimate dehydrogenase
VSERRAAVLGSPIAHSLSPTLHRAAYAALGLDWSYDAIEVDEAGLPGFLATLGPEWVGLSLTMPLKEAVLPLLSGIDADAARVRAVNTVLPDGGGWRGTNTDIDGMVTALRRLGCTGGRGVVLGGGATARSAVAALQRLGLESLVVVARRPEAAEDVAALADGVPVRIVPWGEGGSAVAAGDVVVSAVPGDAGRDLVGEAGGAAGWLLDVAYHPWPTPLAAAWVEGRVASGRDLLLWQAVEQVRLMTGREPDPAAMAAALPAA